MISNDLLQSNYLGRDGFKWWVGQVADPDTSGWGKAKESQNKRRFASDDQEGLEHEVYERRCKVRILGYHTISDADGYVLQDSELPWAHILVPPGTGTGIHGIGEFHEYQGGENVMGFFLDGDDAQQPVIIGGFGRGTQSLDVKDENPSEQTSGLDCRIKPFKPRLQSDLGVIHVQVTPKTEKGGDKEDSNPSTGQSENKKVKPGQSASGSTVLGGSSEETRNNAADKMEQIPKLSRPACNPQENAVAGIQMELNAIVDTLGAIKEYKNLYYDGTVNQITSLSNQIGGGVKTIAGFIRKLLEIVKSDLSEELNRLWSEAQTLLPETPKTILGLTYQEAVKFIMCVFDEITGSGIYDICFKTIADKLLGNIVDAALCAVEEIIAELLDQFLQPILDAISGTLNELASILGDVSGLFEKTIGTALTILNKILSFFDCLPNRFQCAASASWALSGPSKDAENDFANILGKMNIPDIPLPPELENAERESFRCDSNIGYLFPPIVGFSFGDAEAQAFVGNGQVLGIYLVEPGKGYSPLTPPAISIQQPGVYGTGGGAKAIAIVGDDGSISNVCLTSPGSGYVSTPEVVATSIASLEEEDFGLLPLPKTSKQIDAIPYLKDIYIKSPGIGYNDDDTILINGEDPSVYGLELEMDTGPEGYITEINIQNNNNTPPVFSDLPQVSVLSDTGIGAIAVACLGFIVVESQEKDDSGNITATTADGQTITVNASDIKTSINCYLQ